MFSGNHSDRKLATLFNQLEVLTNAQNRINEQMQKLNHDYQNELSKLHSDYALKVRLIEDMKQQISRRQSEYERELVEKAANQNAKAGKNGGVRNVKSGFSF